MVRETPATFEVCGRFYYEEPDGQAGCKIPFIQMKGNHDALFRDKHVENRISGT